MAEKEYIERGAAKEPFSAETILARSIRKILGEVPASDVVEVRHGKWIHDYNNVYGCSECLERETMSPKKPKNYCPNCGAKMDGERKEETT